jgi:hypothetical protein
MRLRLACSRWPVQPPCSRATRGPKPRVQQIGVEGRPIRVDDVGAVGRADVELLADGSAAVTWIEFAGQRSQFRIRRVEPSGARSASSTVAGIAAGRASGYPRLARRGNELLFAWVDTGERPQVRTAVAQLSPPGRTR